MIEPVADRESVGNLEADVPRDGHEVDLDRDLDLAHEIAQEEDRALEHADEQEVAAVVVGRDLRAERLDARAQLVGLDEDLADGAAHATVSSGARSKQRWPAIAADCGIGSS